MESMVIYMENNVRRYRVFLYIFLGFAIGMFCWASYSYYKQSVPDTIRIKAGTSEEINFGIPASGQILADSTRVIALNQPVKIVAWFIACFAILKCVSAIAAICGRCVMQII